MPLLGTIQYTARIGRQLDATLKELDTENPSFSSLETIEKYIMAIGFGSSFLNV